MNSDAVMVVDNIGQANTIMSSMSINYKVCYFNNKYVVPAMLKWQISIILMEWQGTELKCFECNLPCSICLDDFHYTLIKMF